MSIAKQTGVAVANIGKRSGRAWSAIGKSLGRALPAQGGGSGTATTYLSEDWGTGSYTSQTLPTGWTVGLDTHVVYARTGVFSQTYNVAPSSSTAVGSAGWKFDYNSTGSSGTGPNGGLSGGVNATTGTQSTTNRYAYYEASGSLGYNSAAGKAHALVTPELDFSNALSNNTLKLTFWFHIYSSGTGNSVSHDFAVAASTSATACGQPTEVITGSGLTSAGSGSTGGLDIEYWTNDTGTTTTTSNRISGSQQTSNAGLWRKAEVDLNDLAGESSVYLHFVLGDVRYFRADFGLDGIKIVGEE